MKDETPKGPEIQLLSSIIATELLREDDKTLGESIKKKAENLYPLLTLLGTQNLDNEEIKKKIKSLIEEE